MFCYCSGNQLLIEEYRIILVPLCLFKLLMILYGSLEFLGISWGSLSYFRVPWAFRIRFSVIPKLFLRDLLEFVGGPWDF